MTRRLMLVDDHKLFRQGLRALLEKVPDCVVAGEADTGRQALEMIGTVQPDLVVMDVAMKDLNGIEATRQVLEKHPRTKVLALSMHADHRFVAGMLRAGARGYLLKDGAFEELQIAIRAVLQGQIYLSPRITGSLVDDYLQRLQADGTTGLASLTKREREVLQLLAEGRSTKDIAAALGISAKTVESYRAKLMEKLELRSVAELTRFAIREGLTFLEPTKSGF